ncbi:MAG: hypothetical protein HRU14_01415 [Planctomycetes bacterium]|nr:hypothetical protein [Planctomycetota bacterium]
MRITAAFVSILLLVGLASGQIVFDDAKTEKVEAKAKETTAPGAQEQPKAKVSLSAWIDALAAGLGSKDDVVRRSAGAALLSVGAPAMEPMKKLAAGEGRAAREAKKVVAQLERRGLRGTRENPSDRPGRSRRRDAEANSQRLGKALREAGLTDQQMKLVEKGAKDRREKIREIFRQVQDGEISREESRAASRKANMDLQADLKEKLGKEGFKKYQRASRQVNSRRDRDRKTDR